MYSRGSALRTQTIKGSSDALLRAAIELGGLSWEMQASTVFFTKEPENISMTNCVSLLEAVFCKIFSVYSFFWLPYMSQDHHLDNSYVMLQGHWKYFYVARPINILKAIK